MAGRTDDAAALRFSCDCGAIAGWLDPEAGRSGVHAVCFCRDCRAAELWLGRPDPAPGPVDVLQTTPDRVHFDTGTDRLGLVRLGPKGLMRWYATCCNAPLFNTLAAPKLAFAAIHTARLTDPRRIGPVRVHSSIPQPGGGTKHKGWGVMVLRILGGMLAARVTGRWRNTPFFDVQTGAPTVPARVLTKAERATLYPPQRRTKG